MSNYNQSDDGGLTLQELMVFYYKAKDMKVEYHSLNEEERQHITKWVLNRNKVLMYILTGFILVSDLIIIYLWTAGIGNLDAEVEFDEIAAR